MDTLPPTLSYGREPRPHWRRYWRRYAVVALAFVVALGVHRHWSQLTAPVARVYWQHRLDGVTGSSFAVYRESKLRVQSQTGPSPALIRSSNGNGPPEWAAFCRAAGMPNGAWLFVGRLRAPRGRERIVVVSKVGTWSASGLNAPPATTTMPIIADVYEPATLLSPVGLLTSGQPDALFLPEMQLVTFYGGDADPRNPAAFTFRVQSGDAVNTVRGTLRDDDTVKLELLDGPDTLRNDVPVRPM